MFGVHREIAGSNLEMSGKINQFVTTARSSQLLGEAWVLVTTAAREGLPLTFLEAGPYGRAPLSAVNPDLMVSRFGQQVEAELHALMAAPRDRPRGLRIREACRYQYSRALAEHIKPYKRYT
jgi:hypothetical protein